MRYGSQAVSHVSHNKSRQWQWGLSKTIPNNFDGKSALKSYPIIRWCSINYLPPYK